MVIYIIQYILYDTTYMHIVLYSGIYRSLPGDCCITNNYESILTSNKVLCYYWYNYIYIQLKGDDTMFGTLHTFDSGTIERQATVFIHRLECERYGKYATVWVKPDNLCIDSRLFVPELELDSYIQSQIINHVNQELWVSVDENKRIHWNFTIQEWSY